MGKTRTYSELIQLPTFEQRLDYLRVYGNIGYETFGRDRVFYETFLHSLEWKTIRRRILMRDNFCDLGIEDRPIGEGDKIYIHHMNPVAIIDLINSSDFLLLDEYLITTTFRTHNIIHYGTGRTSDFSMVERRPGDTCPWKK